MPILYAFARGCTPDKTGSPPASPCIILAPYAALDAESAEVLGNIKALL